MGELGQYAGRSGLWYYLDSSNTNYSVNGVNIPIVQTRIFADIKNRQMAFDFTSPLRALSMNAFNQVISNGDVFEFDMQYNGIAFHREMKAVGIERLAQDNY